MSLPRYRALLIGNWHYPRDEGSLPDLNGPLNDVSALAQALCDTTVGLFGHDDVIACAERSSAEIAQTLEGFFVEATRGEVLLVYYSGHGLTAPDSGALLLCGQDTRTDRLMTTTVSSELISRLITVSPAHIVVIMLDCCFGGAWKSGTGGLTELGGHGRFVLAASRPRDRAADGRHTSELSHFTSYVVRGLRGEARGSDMDYVTLSDLYSYVHRKMAEVRGAIPHRRFDGDGEIPIARIPTKRAGSRKKIEHPEPAKSGASRGGQRPRKRKPLSEARTALRVEYGERVWAVRFSPSGRHLAAVGDDATARVWDVQSGQEVLRLTHDDHVSAVAFSPDGTLVASSSFDRTARVWSAVSGRKEYVLTHDEPLWSLAFEPAGKLLLTAGGGVPPVRLWQVNDGRPAAESQPILHPDLVTAATFSPDGGLLATAGFDRQARLWEIATGRKALTVDHADVVSSVAFSPDGARLVTGSRDSTARVWDGSTGSELCQLNHAGAVGAAVFSPSGRHVATASRDQTVRLWDAETGVEVLQIKGSAEVNDVVFSPDGRHLAAASAAGRVIVWQVFP